MNIPLPGGLASFHSSKVANLPLIHLGESGIPSELPSISTNVRAGRPIQVPTLIRRGRFSASIGHAVLFNCSRYLQPIPGSDGIIIAIGCGFGAFLWDWRFTTLHTLAVPDHMPFHMAITTGRFALAILILITLITITSLRASGFCHFLYQFLWRFHSRTVGLPVLGRSHARSWPRSPTTSSQSHLAWALPSRSCPSPTQETTSNRHSLVCHTEGESRLPRRSSSRKCVSYPTTISIAPKIHWTPSPSAQSVQYRCQHSHNPLAVSLKCWADWKYGYHYAKDYDVTCLVCGLRHWLSINLMSMWHVSLHDTIDTPSHTPAHTQLLEHTPPYNRLWSLAFEKGIYDQHFHFRLLSWGDCHRDAFTQAQQLPRIPHGFWRRLLEVTVTYSLSDYNNW